ncbi:MAG: hypothetical protein PHR47_03455 [Candidatus Pacebacteria bacterium]|nr:hypothetical protein [Candidatus Paceibacterota bacterium]
MFEKIKKSFKGLKDWLKKNYISLAYAGLIASILQAIIMGGTNMLMAHIATITAVICWIVIVLGGIPEKKKKILVLLFMIVIVVSGAILWELPIVLGIFVGGIIVILVKYIKGVITIIILATVFSAFGFFITSLAEKRVGMEGGMYSTGYFLNEITTGHFATFLGGAIGMALSGIVIAWALWFVVSLGPKKK